MNKDRRLQLTMQATPAQVLDQMERNRRFQLEAAQPKGNTTVATVQNTGVAEIGSGDSVYAFGKPMFRLFGLLDIQPANGKFTTDSIKVKEHAVEIQSLLHECRTLLGPEKWTGGDLSATPTFKQLIGFLVRMMDSLVGGTMNKTERLIVTTSETVTAKAKNCRSGTTNRKKQMQESKYEVAFEPHGEAQFTAINRVEHLTPLDL